MEEIENGLSNVIGFISFILPPLAFIVLIFLVLFRKKLKQMTLLRKIAITNLFVLDVIGLPIFLQYIPLHDVSVVFFGLKILIMLLYSVGIPYIMFVVAVIFFIKDIHKLKKEEKKLINFGEIILFIISVAIIVAITIYPRIVVVAV